MAICFHISTSPHLICMWLQTHWCDTTQSYITATSWLCILSYLAPFESETPWAWASWALMMYDNSLFSKKWSMAAAPKLRKHDMTWSMWVRTRTHYNLDITIASTVQEALAVRGKGIHESFSVLRKRKFSSATGAVDIYCHTCLHLKYNQAFSSKCAMQF